MATQKDIARQLGVSVSLVSRVLSGQAADIGIAADTVRRVQRAAEELGYVPSAAARILKGAPSRTVGVVVFDFTDPFFGPLIGALQRHAHRAGGALALAGFERRVVDLQDLAPLLRQALDGLIVVGGEPVRSWIGPFLARGIPVARIGSGPGGEPVRGVATDHASGLRAALRHLRLLGHRRIGSVCAPLGSHRRRFARLRALAAEAGLEYRTAWASVAGSSVHDAGEAAADKLLRRWGKAGPTALLASSDLVALGAINRLQERGLGVPTDLSVVGFDDLPVARLIRPALTTVRQPIDQLAARAFAAIGGGDEAVAAGTTVTLPAELIVRASTAPAPNRSPS